MWALYASTLIAAMQRFVSWNNSWDFHVLGKGIRKRGIFTVVVLSAGDRHVVDICLPLITSKPRFTHPAVMPSAGVVKGR
jgi:hypothetical protein